MSSTKPIGIVGLGKIGGGMAARLVDRGQSVIGYDIAESARQQAAAKGVRLASSLADVMADCDTILSSLSSVAAIEQTYLGPGGLVTSKMPNLLAAECSTVSPGISRKITQAMHDSGHTAIEASVIGQNREAVAGTLFFVVSGTPQAVARAADVMSLLGRGHVHIGPSGTASAAKLINNAIGAVTLCATAEALALARDLDIDPAAFVQLVTEGQGAGYSVVFERHAKHMASWSKSERAPTPIALKDSMGLVELIGDRKEALPFLSGMAAHYRALLKDPPPQRAFAEILTENAEQRLAKRATTSKT